ncbi:hypothetical protein JZ751_023496 [Albula glossodonta]|uniref:RING-type domain-containing protein n=1 Tax=Albula glossodonta TaxID=121402 RepID=A0A8T2NGT5_9TELE|nr:hypothetical protein JZ751_023496 [Albula glossodonta]
MKTGLLDPKRWWSYPQPLVDYDTQTEGWRFPAWSTGEGSSPFRYDDAPHGLVLAVSGVARRSWGTLDLGHAMLEPAVGKLYLVIEELSQLFRALVPIQLWYRYIVGEDPSSSYVLGAMLIIMYSLCKSFDICGRIAAIRKAVGILCSSQHVFCEECLCLWFDRERTCPLCRAAVIETVRCWKDGTTSAHFQIY